MPMDMTARHPDGTPHLSPKEQIAAAMKAMGVAAPVDKDETPMLVGTKLVTRDRHIATLTYVHRYTGDHTPKWAQLNDERLVNHVQFKDDEEWLANTLFPTNKRGRLIAGPCQSTPTWPWGNGTPEHPTKKRPGFLARFFASVEYDE